MSEMIDVLDHMASYQYDDDTESEKSSPQRTNSAFIIHTDTIIRGSTLSKEDTIDEALKAKFLARLIREYRRNRERENREHLKEMNDQEIEKNIYQRFPSLNNSSVLDHSGELHRDPSDSR